MRSFFSLSTTNYPVTAGRATEIQARTADDLLAAAERLSERSYKVVMVYDVRRHREATRAVLERLSPALLGAEVLLAYRDPEARRALPKFLSPQSRERRPDCTLATLRHEDHELSLGTDSASLSIHPTTGRFSRWAVDQGLEPTVLRFWTGKPERSRQLHNLLTR